MPTCTEKGIKTNACVNCGFEKSTEISAKGHTYLDWIVVTPATCDGVHGYHYHVCADCGYEEGEEILEAARHGADLGFGSMDYVAAAPHCIRRLEKIMADMEADPSEANLRHLLYYVYGNGLESIDCFTVAMAVFLAKGKDVFGALKLCASLGGDTDTVGALVGALCAAHAGGHNIPQNLLDTVVANNHLNLEQVARDIQATFWK